MTKENVIFQRTPGKQGDVGMIILNRPERLNAMTTSMCHQVYEKLREWAQDTTIKAVVIRGEGEKAFCAGGDIRHFYDMGRTRIDASMEFFWQEYRLNHAIFHFPKPYIALTHGITMGGGVGVSIHGSHRVAAENLLFAMPETNIGFHPDIGASYFLIRCVDKTGFYLGLTGETINAQDAHYTGLIDAIVPYAHFDLLIEKIAAATWTDDANAAINEVIQHLALPAKSSVLLDHRVAMDHCFSKNSLQEIMDALQQQHTPWAAHVVKTLLTRSPTSLAVTFEKLQKSMTLNFDECLRMDYRLTHHFLEQADFYEGIRAAVVDKDRSPRWVPAQLSEVSLSQIENYFVPLKKELDFSP